MQEITSGILYLLVYAKSLKPDVHFSRTAHTSPCRPPTSEALMGLEAPGLDSTASSLENQTPRQWGKENIFHGLSHLTTSRVKSAED